MDKDIPKSKNISITNELVRKILFNSNNASKLIEESILYFVDAIHYGDMDKRQVSRIFSQGLIRMEDFK